MSDKNLSRIWALRSESQMQRIFQQSAYLFTPIFAETWNHTLQSEIYILIDKSIVQIYNSNVKNYQRKSGMVYQKETNVSIKVSFKKAFLSKKPFFQQSRSFN